MKDLQANQACAQAFGFGGGGGGAEGGLGETTGIAYYGTTGVGNFVSLRQPNADGVQMLKAPQGENPHGNAYLAADCSSCHAAKTHVDARGLELRAYTSQLALEEAGGNIILLNTEKQGVEALASEPVRTRLRFASSRRRPPLNRERRSSAAFRARYGRTSHPPGATTEPTCGCGGSRLIRRSPIGST